METFIHYWWECKLAQPLWKTKWWFLKKKKIELSYDPTFGYLSQGYENTNANRYMHPQHYLQQQTYENNLNIR